MANFEGLIRGALETRDASDPQVRQQIYQSSRNALNRLLAENRTLTVESALTQQRRLEDTIQQIEADFVQPPAETPPVPVDELPAEPDDIPPSQSLEQDFELPDPPEQAPQENLDPPIAQPAEAIVETDPLQEIQSLLREKAVGTRPDEQQETSEGGFPQAELPQASPAPPEPQPIAPEPVSPQVHPQPVAQETHVSHVSEAHNAPEITADDLAGHSAPPLEFSNRRRLQKRFFLGTLILGILVLLGWISYIVATNYFDGSLSIWGNTQRGTEVSGASGGQDTEEGYITIMEPGDLSALVTAGRGESEIVNQLNSEMIRIVSVRDGDNRAEPARPILIKIRPGILEKIAGQTVNVEIYAKSGTENPATFSVECQFGILGECGRKRFRIGLQPEAVVFSIQMREGEISGSEAYLAINTDITGTAEITGRGDVMDIVYARLRAVQ